MQSPDRTLSSPICNPIPQWCQHFSLFREGLALLLDQNDGDVYCGTERGLTCLWPLRLYERKVEVGAGGAVRERWEEGELHKHFWEHLPLGSLAEKVTPRHKVCSSFTSWFFSMKSV